MRIMIMVETEHGNYSAFRDTELGETELGELADGLLQAGAGVAGAMGFCPSQLHAIFECQRCGFSPWGEPENQKGDVDE